MSNLVGFSDDGEAIYSGDLFVVASASGVVCTMPIKAEWVSTVEEIRKCPPQWCPLDCRIKLFKRRGEWDESRYETPILGFD